MDYFPIPNFVFVTPRDFKCASLPRLLPNLHSMFEMYHWQNNGELSCLYKAPEVRRCPAAKRHWKQLPYVSTPFSWGRDLSRGPLTMRMRLIWFALPYPAAAQPSLGCHCFIYSPSCVCGGCVLASTENKGRERNTRANTNSVSSSKKRVSSDSLDPGE